MPAKPSKPVPKSNMVVGSGTGLGSSPVALKFPTYKSMKLSSLAPLPFSMLIRK